MIIILILGSFCFYFDHYIINIIDSLNEDQKSVLVNFLDTEIYNNEGLIFGIMSDYHKLAVILVSVILFSIGFLFLKFVNCNQSAKSGIKVALGGSLGNILHRLSCGHVHDYIDFFFVNLSHGDVLIISGIFMVFLFGSNKIKINAIEKNCPVNSLKTENEQISN